MDRGQLLTGYTGRPRTLRVAGLFAGIGGLEVGLARSGHECGLHCEIDPAARAVLQRHFGGVRLVEDVNDLQASSLAGVDVVTAGFPCQDLSQAGQMAGINGTRSGLVSRLFDLLDAGGHEVTWLVLENVPFMLHLGGGAAMRYITSRLTSLGYSWAYRTVDALAFGRPQRRRRVFLVASRTEDPRAVLLADDAEPVPTRKHGRAAYGFYWTEGNSGLGWAMDAVPTLKGGSGTGIPSPPGIWLADGRIVTLDIRDAERLQGFRAGWTEGIPRHIGRHRGLGTRWRLVGNAVSVSVAAWIGQRLRAPGEYNSSADEPLETTARWPYAAWSIDGTVHQSSVGMWPVATPVRRLGSFLQYSDAPLSARATRGFLMRLKASTLRVDAKFMAALERHLSDLAPRSMLGISGRADQVSGRVRDQAPRESPVAALR